MSTEQPTTKEELRQYILTQLGDPVIEINIADIQLDVCIRKALDFFTEYHVDGMEKKYIAVQITQADIDNKYVNVPTRVSGVSKVFRPRDKTFGLSGENLFDVEYYLYRNEIFELTKNAGGLTSYYLTQQHIALMDDILNYELRYRFNKVTNRLYVDTNWTKNFPVDSYLAYECYEEIDPDEYPEMYSHWVIKDLAVAHSKKQWGSNLQKYEGMQLPGGVTLNGETLVQQANDEIERIQTDFILRFQEPDEFEIG